ncbi:MAG: dihydrodipicolinate synthase family protein [Bryobacterales bacterium]|nr:dihydrodipicolinate synthase family protein [Bryobacterales bacterium]
MKISRRDALGMAVTPLLATATSSVFASNSSKLTTVPKGMWPAMLTPFKQDRSVDWYALDALTDWYLKAGADGMFACAASGEVWSLSEEERLKVTERVVKRSGKVPVVSAGLPGRDARTIRPYVNRLMDTGAVAAILMTNQIAEKDEPDAVWRGRVEAILAATGDTPFGAYEVPSPYKRLLTPEMMGWAAKTGRFVFLKDTSLEVEAIAAKCVAAKGSPFRLFNAHVPILVEAIRHGAAGFCGIAGNAYPDIVAYATHQALDAESASKAQEFLTRNEQRLGMAYPLTAKILARLAGVPIEPVCRAKSRTLNSEQMALLNDVHREAVALMS